MVPGTPVKRSSSRNRSSISLKGADLFKGIDPDKHRVTDLAAVRPQGREHPLPPRLHGQGRGDVVVGRRVQAGGRGGLWEDMLVQLERGGGTECTAGAHHGLRHRNVIGMAGTR
jgi:hypothetical protein